MYKYHAFYFPFLTLSVRWWSTPPTVLFLWLPPKQIPVVFCQTNYPGKWVIGIQLRFSRLLLCSKRFPSIKLFLTAAGFTRSLQEAILLGRNERWDISFLSSYLALFLSQKLLPSSSQMFFFLVRKYFFCFFFTFLNTSWYTCT